MKYPLNVYMSPRNAIARFNALISKYGAGAIEKAGSFKEEKELLVTGKLMLGIQKITGNKYYLRPAEDIAQDTDVQVITWGDESDNSKFEKYDIQVTDYESHNHNLVDVIEKKIKKQGSHGQETRELVVNIWDHPSENIHYVQIAKKVAALNPTFKSIWLLMNDAEDTSIYHAIQVWRGPEMYKIIYKLKDEADKQGPPDFVNIRRGTTNDWLSPMKTFHLPLP